MAKPTTQRPGAFTIWVGDGATTEDFSSKTCGFTSKGIAFTNGTSDVTVPDCDDPDAPSWTERTVTAKEAIVTGSGVMAEETFTFWNDWFLDGTAKNVRVVLDITTAGYWHGSFLPTAWGVTGNQDDGKVQVTVTLANDGEVAWSTGAP
jgi:hypothetical protein